MAKKKYMLLVERKSPSGVVYIARKTIYATSKKAAAEAFSRTLGKKVNVSYIIDVQKALAEQEKKSRESKVEIYSDINEETKGGDKPD